MRYKKELYKILVRITIMVLLSLVLQGCDDNVVDTGNTNENNDAGRVRFIHSASSIEELDVTYLDLADGKYYAFERSATYGHQYGYYDFYTGERSMTAFLSSTSIAVATADFALGKDEKYTVIAHDFEATVDPVLFVVADTIAVPDSGRAFVRFMHLSADAPEVVVYDAQSGATVAELGHLEKTSYLTINASTYHYQVKERSSSDLLLTVTPVTFLSGQAYTIILSGTITGLTSIGFNGKVYRETSL